MSTKNQADKLSSDAAAEMPGYVETGGEVYRFDNSDAAKKISEICCLAELFEVVEAAEDYTTEREYQNVEHCRRDMNMREEVLLKALATLRAKLPPHFHSTSGGKNE